MTGEATELRRQRWKLTARLARALDTPMLALSAVWSVLLLVEFTRGLSPWLQRLSDAIWSAFGAQFVLEFAAAPGKVAYLRKHWITALSLALPAFRLARVARLARVFRIARGTTGLRVARLLGGINRGMRLAGLTFRRRGIGYLLATTLLVTVLGAAGMYRFELDAAGGPEFADYGTALSLSLQVEIEGAWPWQTSRVRKDANETGPSERTVRSG